MTIEIMSLWLRNDIVAKNHRIRVWGSDLFSKHNLAYIVLSHMIFAIEHHDNTVITINLLKFFI